MRKLWFTLLVLVSIVFDSSGATLYTYTNGGSSGFWKSAGTWTTDPSGATLVGSAVPQTGDVVNILNGFTVLLDENVTATGLTINIASGGTLDLSTHTIGSISVLSGAGTLRIKSGYFPTVTTNSFNHSASSGATVEYYDFTGTIPATAVLPNVVFRNTTGAHHAISFANTSSPTNITIAGTLVTNRSGAGTLSVLLGSQITNIINLTISRNITIGSGTTFGVGVFNAIHNVVANANFTNDGTVDFSNSSQYTTPANGGANLRFTGATNNTFTINGQTDLYTLTIEKGTGSNNTLAVSSSNSTYLNFYSRGQLIMINTGTLRLRSGIDIPRLYGVGSDNYNVGSSTASPMLWVDGATINAAGSALVIYGKFRITDGSFTTLGGEGSVIREEGQYIIEGGVFTTEKFRPSTTATTHRGSFTMSGGVFNASGTTSSNASYARFSLPYPEQVFIMSGGTINVTNPIYNSGASALGGGIHIGCKTSNYTVTGGTFNAILSGNASVFNISSTAPFWNLNISRTGGTPTTVRLAGIGNVGDTERNAQPLVVLNDFIIDGTNDPVFNPNNLNVTVGRHFTISSGATYTPGTNTTIFNGSNDQTFTNNGTITSGLYNLTIGKTSGTASLAGSSSFVVRNTLSLQDGVFNDGGKSVSVQGPIYNEAVHTGTGNLTLEGSSTQEISGDGTGVFGNITVNNTNVPGVRLTADMSISGVLNLASSTSLVDIESYLLNITSTSASAITCALGFNSSRMIRTLGLQSDRGVRKVYGNLNAFTFPFGVSSNYTPATVTLSVAPTSYGSITARPVASRHPLISSGNTNNIQWYWKIASSGFTGLAASSVSHTYQYQDGVVSGGADEAAFIPARYNNGTWTTINDIAQVNESANTIAFSAVSYLDGDYTTGIPASFGVIRIFYSKRNGNWNNVTSGQTPWSNESHTGADATSYPTQGDQVFIGDGATNNHTITITSNNQLSGGLEINAGSTLDVGTTTGHNFGRQENVPIGGSGTLKISSSTGTAQFPAGDFGNFIRSSGGIVEYYTTGSQDFTIPLTSPSPTLLPLISYRNLRLTPGSGRSITLPNQDLRIYANLTVQGTASNGIAALNSSSAKTVTIDGNLNVTGGTLEFRNGSAQLVDVAGNVSISSGAAISVAAVNAVVTNRLSVKGSLTNNGILDLSNAAYHCNALFTGNANATITGTGATTDFHVLTISKGTSISTLLDVNATAFSVSAANQPVILQSGTFRLSSNQNITLATDFDFDIPATARLSANGGSFQITGGDEVDLLLAGTLEIISGTVNVGTTDNENSIVYAATGSPTIAISGGTLNVKAQLRRSYASSQGGLTYNQSGASSVNVALFIAPRLTRGVFEVLNTGSSFTMSGGTLTLYNGNVSSAIADLYLHPATNSVTGGTITVGSSSSTFTYDINTAIPLYNFTVAGAANVSRLEVNPLTLRGSLTIATGNNVFNANSLDVSIAGNFTNAHPSSGAPASLSIGGYQPVSSNQTTTFNGAGTQTISGITGNVTKFANLVINSTSPGGVVTLQANTTTRVLNGLTLSNGTFAVTSNVVTIEGPVYNGATNTSTTGYLALTGSSAKSVTGNGNGVFGNVTINNTNGVFLFSNQEITGTLTFVDGLLNIGASRLFLSNVSNAAIQGNDGSKYIVTSGRLSDGGVRKAFAGSLAGESFTFPIGVSGKLTPVTYTLTTGAGGGNITVVPVNSVHPSATGPGDSYINYYWNVASTIANVTSAIHTYTYQSSDQAGDPSEYFDARFSNGGWEVGVNGTPIGNVITFTNTDFNSDYTAGEPTAFVDPTTYISTASDNWESDSWSPDPPGVFGPPAGSFVIIAPGHTITVTGNSKRIATLDVQGRLHLGVTTGHDFGTVSATGASSKTIQIESSTFPSGNFTNFTAAGTGTVEYKGAFSLPTQSTYNNIVFTGSGIKVLPNALLTINGNFTIQQGTVTAATNNRDILLASATSNFTNNGSFIAGSGAMVIGGDLINDGASANFTGGSGNQGIRVGGNASNLNGATLSTASDSLVVSGNFTNQSVFNPGVGGVRVVNQFTNSASASFTGTSGSVKFGSLVNNGSLSNGSGTMFINGAFINTTATASFNLNSGSLRVGGDFTNSVTATFNGGTGSILINGNWNNSSTFNAGSSGVTFGSTTSKTLTGTTTFYNLSKTNGGALVLASNINVTGQLSLTDGNITTGTNLVSLTATGSQPVVTTGPSSFIDGRLSIAFPNDAGTTRVFPVGKGTIYRPVSIQQTAASTSPVVAVEVINSPPTGLFPSSIERLSDARYYSINLLSVSNPINDPIIQINFNTNGVADENISTPGNVHVMRATSASGPWQDQGGSGVFSPAAPAGYATSEVTSIATTTYFTLGYQQTILPIELSDFSVSLLNDIADIRWTTETEINNDYFTVERSADGVVFDSIAFINGAGTTHDQQNYQLFDYSPLDGRSYYRLKQTDFDGTFTYSKIRSITNNPESRIRVNLFPNPAKRLENINLAINNQRKGGIAPFIVVTTVEGKPVLEKTMADSNVTDLNELSDLAPGFYIVKVVAGNDVAVIKLVLQ